MAVSSAMLSGAAAESQCGINPKFLRDPLLLFLFTKWATAPDTVLYGSPFLDGQRLVNPDEPILASLNTSRVQVWANALGLSQSLLQTGLNRRFQCPQSSYASAELEQAIDRQIEAITAKSN